MATFLAFLLTFGLILCCVYPILFLIIVGIGIAIYVIRKIYNNSDYAKQNKIRKNQEIIDRAKKLQQEMNSCGVFPTYITSNKITAVYFDENNRKIYVPNLSTHKVISIDNITRYEIVSDTNSNIQYTLGTAINGKFKQNVEVKNVSVCIYLNSIDTPYVIIPCMFINYGYQQTNAYEATILANKIIGALDYLKRNTLTEKKPILDIVPKLEIEEENLENVKFADKYAKKTKNEPETITKRIIKIVIHIILIILLIFVVKSCMSISNHDNIFNIDSVEKK